MAGKLLAILCILFGVCFYIKAATACPKFKFEGSDDWQFPGRVINYTLTTSMCSGNTTSINARIKLPYNNSASMRLTRCKLVMDNSKLSFTGSTEMIMMSSQNNGVIDEASVNLKEVTATADTDIKIECLAQVTSSPSNGIKNWVSAGVEYTNGSVWVAQLAFRSFLPWKTKPVLIVTPTIVEEATDRVLQGSQFILSVKLSHNMKKTTADAKDVLVKISSPKSLKYSSSSASEVVSNDNHILTIKIKAVNFTEESEFNVTYLIDPSKTMADGKVHRGLLVIQAGCCSKQVRLKAMKRFKYYVPRAACDAAVGMASGAITDDMILGSSYAVSGSGKGRIRNTTAWIPLQHDKRQFLQVKFASIMKINRLAVQGRGSGYNDTLNAFVKTFTVYYSNDCAVWKPVKKAAKTKVFKGNKNRYQSVVVPLGKEIEAKCIQIRPQSWKKQINLRVEFYGCASSATSPAGQVALSSRLFAADPSSSYVYVCGVKLDWKPQYSSCYLTKDSGASWIALDRHILNIEFLNPATRLLYGIGSRGTYYACSMDLCSCSVASATEYAGTKATPGVAMVKKAGHLTIARVGAAPLVADVLNVANGRRWGATGEGVFYHDGSSWKSKATWL